MCLGGADGGYTMITHTLASICWWDILLKRVLVGDIVAHNTVRLHQTQWRLHLHQTLQGDEHQAHQCDVCFYSPFSGVGASIYPYYCCLYHAIL